MDPTDTQATACVTVVDELVRNGVRHAVLSPGSRSTPLALALARDERMRLEVVHDERSAGFLALGIGVATGVPAVVLTTSGTAAVELHPAVVEAHHARVPLVVVTADRPPELHGVGAPQTIDQHELYGSAVRWFLDPGPLAELDPPMWRWMAARAVAESTGSPPGPAHLNLPFREPLVGMAGQPMPSMGDQGPLLRSTGDAGLPAPAELDTLADLVEGRRVLVLAGGGIDDPVAVAQLTRSLGWPLLADPRCGCRAVAPDCVTHFDALVRHERFADAHTPEVVLRLGAPPSSRATGEWLARSGALVLGIDTYGGVWDPEQISAATIAAPPAQVLDAIHGRLAARGAGDASDWREAWLTADRGVDDAVAALLGGALSSPAVARQVVAGLPPGSQVVVASSMPVRDVEWWAPSAAGVTVQANRGANGIDGVLATALGVAVATSAPTVALVGDLAFLYDTPALVAIARRSLPLTVVVVDNDGGGIFSYLPQATALSIDEFEALFGTPHGRDLVAIARGFGLDAELITSAADLDRVLEEAPQRVTPRVAVIRTTRDEARNAQRELHAAVAAVLDAAN